MVKWRDLRLSTDMLKIHGIEDDLVNQMRLFTGIGCFIEDFIEQAHQSGMKDKKEQPIVPYNFHVYVSCVCLLCVLSPVYVC